MIERVATRPVHAISVYFKMTLIRRRDTSVTGMALIVDTVVQIYLLCDMKVSKTQ